MAYDHEFKDKKGRTIGFDVSEGSIRAYFRGKRIGEFTLNVDHYDERFAPLVQADVIDVDQKFRMAGIASEMVRLAFEQHGRILPPSRYEPEPAKRNSISPEGMQVILSGQRKGWFAEFPDSEKPVDDFWT